MPTVHDYYTGKRIYANNPVVPYKKRSDVANYMPYGKTVSVRGKRNWFNPLVGFRLMGEALENYGPRAYRPAGRIVQDAADNYMNPVAIYKSIQREEPNFEKAALKYGMPLDFLRSGSNSFEGRRIKAAQKKYGLLNAPFIKRLKSASAAGKKIAITHLPKNDKMIGMKRKRASPRNAKVRTARRVGNSSYQATKFGRKRRIDKMRRKGVVVEEDTTVTVSDPRTVYFGHYSHPLFGVQRVVCLSLAKMIGQRVFKHTPMSMEEVVGGSHTIDAKPSWRIEIFYSNREHDNEDVDRVQHLFSGTDTYLTVADQIYAMLALICETGGGTINRQPVRIREITVNQSISPGGIGLHTFKAADIKVAVRGQSYMKYQNATLADTAGSSDRHDINANPVEGRCYFGKGSMFELKRRGDFLIGGNGEGNLTVDSRYGFGSFGADDFTDASIDRLMEHPPRYFMWYGMKHDRYCRMQPGTMAKSSLSGTHLLKLNQWLRYFQGEISTTAANVSGVQKKTSMGQSRWFGVDKMIHDSTDDATIINIETHVRLTGCAYYKRKVGMTGPIPSIPNYSV